MPDNQEGQLVGIVQSFHDKMDKGFSGIHERIGVIEEKRETFDKAVTKRVTDLENEQKHLTIPTQPCTDMTALKEAKKKEEEAEQDIKHSVVKEGAVWGFRGIVAMIIIKLGIDRWF